VLKTVELFGGWKPMCFNCAGQILHLEPMPKTLAEMREIVSRERRRTDRRVGKPDSRVYRYERRVGERRAGREYYPSVEDDMIIEVSTETPVGDDFEELTQIHELLRELRPANLAG
jgi:hypothetical protein